MKFIALFTSLKQIDWIETARAQEPPRNYFILNYTNYINIKSYFFKNKLVNDPLTVLSTKL